LTSQWKAGKTTLVSVLLKHLSTGNSLAGLRVKPTKGVIVSEERLDRWQRRNESLRFGNNVIFLCRHGQIRTTPESWQGLIGHLERLGRDEGVELVVLDPLAPFLPGATENLSAAMRNVLEPLEQLTSAGQSVLLVHHPRKGKTAPGQAARGSGALSAFVDVLMEMRLPVDTGPLSRRRRLRAWSRFDGTPRNRIIELSEDGTSYGDLEYDPHVPAGYRLAPVAMRLLRNQPSGVLSRDQMLERWPRELKVPHPLALWRALDEAVKSGQINQQGSGRRNDPFCYLLPESTWNLRD
jgi:hypothetical protein